MSTAKILGSENPVQALDSILERTSITSTVTKPDPKARGSDSKQAKRAAKNGVSLFLVVLIIIATNAFWLGYIEYHIRPSYQATIDEIMADKEDSIRRIQAVYKVREQDFEKRLAACEEKQAELETMYQNAVLIIEKYGGDTDLIPKTEEVKTE